MTSKGKTSWAQRCAGIGYLIAWAVVPKIPARAGRWITSRVVASLRRRATPVAVKLEANLAVVLASSGRTDQLPQVVDQAIESYGRYWYETFLFSRKNRAQLAADFHIERSQELQELYQENNGLILALTHSGNWDHAAAWASHNNIHIMTVAERLRPEFLYRRFVAHRTRLGITVLPLSGAGNVFAKLQQHLERGKAVALLADRDLTGTGTPVNFFGKKATIPSGPALLAARTGAPLIVMSVWYEKNHTHACWYGPFYSKKSSFRTQVLELTGQMTAAFEQTISAHPEDWHMTGTIWKKHE